MDAQPTAEEETASTPVAITIQLIVLAVAFVIGRALERIRFQWMGEAGAALLLGLVVGLVLKAAGVEGELAAAVAFKGGVFFYILLPTIMFDAGYSLDTRMFIKNVGSVCTYAFVGTTISCFVVGLMMWAFGSWGWCFQMPLLANLTFGALISATDPVTVLAVFNRLNAQPDLYMNVFGESVLNDAVGMVLYNVISSFLGGKDVNAGSVFAGIGLFVGIFLGSTAIGIAIGLLAAFIFRSRYFYSGPIVVQPHGSAGVEAGAGSGSSPEVHMEGGSSTFEVGLAVVFAYGSYLVADAVHCSGIVAVVVNGMVMNMYVRPNLSAEAAHKIETLFKTLAGLFELFVFCYIGSTMFLQEEEFNIAGYTALSLLALAVSRAVNILPCTAVVNLLRPRERHIPPRAQFMLWWSGLRGAMAFALSVEAAERFGVYGKVMKTCTFYLIFVTVLFNGGSSAYFLQRLRLRAEDTPALLPYYNADASDSFMHGFGSDDVKWLGPGLGRVAEEGGEEEGASDSPEGEEGERGEGPGEGGRGKGRGGGGRREGGGGRRWTRSASGGGALETAAGGGEAGTRHKLPRWLRSKAAAAASGDGATAAAAGGGRVPSGVLRTQLSSSSSGRRLLAKPAALLERVRSFNDGRLVDRFDEFDRKVSRLLIHPDARRDADLASSPALYRASLGSHLSHVGSQGGASGGGSAHGGPSHGQPQTLSVLSPSPSWKQIHQPPPSEQQQHHHQQQQSLQQTAAPMPYGGGGSNGVVAVAALTSPAGLSYPGRGSELATMEGTSLAGAGDGSDGGGGGGAGGALTSGGGSGRASRGSVLVGSATSLGTVNLPRLTGTGSGSSPGSKQGGGGAGGSAGGSRSGRAGSSSDTLGSLLAFPGSVESPRHPLGQPAFVALTTMPAVANTTVAVTAPATAVGLVAAAAPPAAAATPPAAAAKEEEKGKGPPGGRGEQEEVQG